MPRCGITFDENSPLLGGANELGWVVPPWNAHPVCLATAVATAATPPTEGIFKRAAHAALAAPPRMKAVEGLRVQPIGCF